MAHGRHYLQLMFFSFSPSLSFSPSVSFSLILWASVSVIELITNPEQLNVWTLPPSGCKVLMYQAIPGDATILKNRSVLYLFCFFVVFR